MLFRQKETTLRGNTLLEKRIKELEVKLQEEKQFQQLLLTNLSEGINKAVNPFEKDLSNLQS